MFVACHWISFLLKAELYSIVCIYHILFIHHPWADMGCFHLLAVHLLLNLSVAPICLGVTRPPKLDLIAETISKPALSLQPHPLSHPHVCDALATLDSLEAPRHALFPLAAWPLHMFFSLSGMLYLPNLLDPPISCLSLSGPFCLSLDKLSLTPQIWNLITLDHPFLFSCRFVLQAWELFLERGLFY